MSRTPHLLLLGGLAITAGCELTATVSAVALYAETPDILAAIDPDLSPLIEDIVGEESFSEVQQATLATVAIVDRGGVFSASVEPVRNADVEITWNDVKVDLCETEDGIYTGSSTGVDCPGAASLAYAVDAAYDVSIDAGEEHFGIHFRAPPGVNPTLINLRPAPTPLDFVNPLTSAEISLDTHPCGEDLHVDWREDGGVVGRDSFVTLARVLFTGNADNPLELFDSANWAADPANPIYDDFPRDQAALIDLIINSHPIVEVDLDGALLNRAGLYLFIVTTAELLTDISGGLFVASGSLAGSGSARAFFIEDDC